MMAFPSHNQKAFNGFALVIIRSSKVKPVAIKVSVSSSGIQSSEAVIKQKNEVVVINLLDVGV